MMRCSAILIILSIVATLLWLPYTPVVAQVPTVAPSAISTPTPPSLLPTPTPEALNNGYHRGDQPTHYAVQPGDTLLSVALEMGLDLAEVPCAVSPDFAPDQPLVIGNQLEAPPLDVTCHLVAPGETIWTIAAQANVAAEAIYRLAWNQLSDQPLARLQFTHIHTLRIPRMLPAGTQPITSLTTLITSPPQGSTNSFLPWMLQQPVGTSPFVALAVGGPSRALRSESGQVPANWPYGSGDFAWPLYGWLTQGYRYDHRALDIAANAGTLVTAADRGVVLRAGWNNQGYGRVVIIDHNIDYVTLYAHLSEVLVEEGQVVAQGQVIGKVGSTGNSTGPHLHFEIRDFGRLINPLELLAH